MAEDPQSQPPPPASDEQGNSRAATPVWRTSSFWLKTLSALISAAILIWAFRFSDSLALAGSYLRWSLSAPPSAIYVESPEVYTRERLINERSAEEAWLNAQLAKIDSADLARTNIVNRLLDTMQTTIGTDGSSSDASTSGSDTGGSPASGGESTSTPGEPQLTFDQDFRLRSAYRSLVRQRMIENRLDDRHDLEGNALYILKFDSTVMGVPAYRERAVIKVSILPPSQLKNVPSLEALDSDPAAFEYASLNFQQWQKSLQQRMNKELAAELKRLKTTKLADYENRVALLEQISDAADKRGISTVTVETILQAFLTGTPSQNEQDAALVLTELYYFMSRMAVAKVTGDSLLDVQLVAHAEAGAREDGQLRQVPMTSPLTSEFVNITLKLSPDPAATPLIEVYPLASAPFLTNRDCTFAKPDAYPDYYQALEKDGLALWQHFKQQVPVSDDMLSSILALSVRKLNAANASSGVIKVNARDQLGCKLEYGLWVESGLINFSRKIGRFNTYSYSVLPRENPVSVFGDIALTSKAAASFEQTQAARSVQRQTKGWELRPVLSTFGDTVEVKSEPSRRNDTPTEGNDSARFVSSRPDTEPVVGWVIDLSAQLVDESRRSQPVTVNESVIAIVSVPAWWSEIDVKVERGWLGSGRTDKGLLYSVKLPNRAELLDTLLFGDVGRQPFVTEVDASAAFAMGTCDEAVVLILGQRLWRNTAVTIGSVKADQVEVLPNMEGILAKFRTHPLAPAANAAEAQRGLSQISGKLRVWTSYGVSDHDGVAIQVPPNCK